MAELSGFVQYRFRSDENDADILLRGDADWVRSKIAEMGLEDVGWMMPIGQESRATNTSGIKTTSKSKTEIEIDDQPLGEKPLDMGP